MTQDHPKPQSPEETRRDRSTYFRREGHRVEPPDLSQVADQERERIRRQQARRAVIETAKDVDKHVAQPEALLQKIRAIRSMQIEKLYKQSLLEEGAEQTGRISLQDAQELRIYEIQIRADQQTGAGQTESDKEFLERLTDEELERASSSQLERASSSQLERASSSQLEQRAGALGGQRQRPPHRTQEP